MLHDEILLGLMLSLYSKVLVALVLMLLWSSQLPHAKFDFLDLFAGAGNGSKYW